MSHQNFCEICLSYKETDSKEGFYQVADAFMFLCPNNCFSLKRARKQSDGSSVSWGREGKDVWNCLLSVVTFTIKQESLFSAHGFKTQRVLLKQQEQYSVEAPKVSPTYTPSKWGLLKKSPKWTHNSVYEDIYYKLVGMET